METARKVFGMVRRSVEMDLRSIALFRISLSFLLLMDIFLRLRDFHMFYSSSGLVPAWNLMKSGGITSLFLMSSEDKIALLWFGVMIVICCLLMIGYKSQRHIILIYVLYSSLHTRNELVLDGGDRYLRCILFFACFVPLGAYYSVDYAQQRHYPKRESSFGASRRSDEESGPIGAKFRLGSVGTLAVMAQIFWCYYASGVVKTGPEWSTEYTALEKVLQCDSFINRIGLFARELLPSGLARMMTFSVLYLEILIPFFLFLGPISEWLRMFGVAGITALHAGFIVMMTLGIFPWFCMAVVSITLPPLFWELMARLFRTRLDRQRGIKLHWLAVENWTEDSDSKNSLEFLLHMSRGEWVIRLVHTFLFPHDHVVAGPVSSGHVPDSAEQEMTGVNVDVESGRSFAAKQHQFWAEDARGVKHVGFEFWQFVFTHSVFGLFWSRVLFNLLRRVTLPRQVVTYCRARDRQAKLGPARATNPRRSPKPNPSSRPVRIFAGVMVVYLTWWNMYNLGWVSMSPGARQVAYTFKIDQYWRLFAPSPCSFPEWPAILAVLNNGSHVDMWRVMYHPSPSTYDWAETKPTELASEVYQNYRWKRYWGNIWAREGNNEHMARLIAYTCKHATSEKLLPPNSLKTLQAVTMAENVDTKRAYRFESGPVWTCEDVKDWM